jgi:lipopolysaccharide biosynthesis regulator YciM
VAKAAEDASVLAQTANAIMDLDGDVARATALAERAIATNPGCARAWFISGVAHLVEGNGDVAVEHLERAARLDPISSLNDVIRAHIGVGHFVKGDFNGALSAILATTHRTARIHLALAAIYGYLGRPRESREELARFEKRSSLPAEEMIASAISADKARALLLHGIELGREASLTH